jgi:hypothetical protein
MINGPFSFRISGFIAPQDPFTATQSEIVEPVQTPHVVRF